MALIIALDQGDIAEVQRILEDHPEEVREPDEDGKVALHYAASRSDINTLKLIYVSDRSLVDTSDNEGYTPLLCALMEGKLDHAEFLARNGANVNHVDVNGRSFIHWTVVCAQLDALNWSIAKEVDVNLKDSAQRCTALHYSTCVEDMPPEVSQALLITLLRHKADPNATDIDNRTAIHWCSSSGNLEALQALYNSGGDLTVKDKDQLSVLHCAASHGYHEIIEFVINRVNKTLVDEPDRAGHTALFYAISFGHYESALKLLQHGADPNYQDMRLRTPSHNAASKGQMRMLKLLKQFNASFDIQNYRGDVPFHEAVQSGSKDVIEWLLAMDESVLDTPNHNGRTGLHLAAAAGNLEIVILLCSRKCYVDPLMSFKNEVHTPLDLANRQSHEVVVEYLTKLCNAKSSKDFTPEYIEDWKISFETMVAEAKKRRNQQMDDLKDRRPSTTDGIAESVRQKQKKIADVGVNTSQRNTRSADSNSVKRKYSKSTSVTNLMEIPSVPKQELEALKESIANGQKLVDENEEDDDHVDILDIDEEFENLPPISDISSSATDSEDHSSDDEKSDEVARKVTIQEVKTAAAAKVKKEVRIDSGHTRKKRVASGKTRKSSHDGDKEHSNGKENKKGKVMMRVRREPEIGSDGGEVDIYDDGDGHHSDEEIRKPSATPVTNRKYIHERAIFQELTHLKRMQIQYGKVLGNRMIARVLCRNQVQEKVLVRSLISNFCRMHNLDVRNFKFTTFYAWERFLYDALSEQLKIIYLEERERLADTNSEGKQTNAMKLNKFDSKIRNSVPPNDQLRDMHRIYTHAAISQKSTRGKSSAPKESSRKRCDCLDKHLFL